MKKCYDCMNYRTSYFCGYESCECEIYGSLDMDQKERHPDVTANSCPDYTPKPKQGDKFEWLGSLWVFDKYTERGYIEAHSIGKISDNAIYGEGSDCYLIPEREIKII